MIEIKKGTLKDQEKLCFAIMRLKNSKECITNAEMQEYLDRTYYCEIDGEIVAVITAIRELLTDTTQYPSYSITTHPNRYIVKYCLFDKYTIDRNHYDSVSIMNRLMKELCADLSDWSVWIDVEYQADISESTSKEDVINILSEVAKNNSFKEATNRFSFIRVTPIDFGSLH